jgi:hypothetical protein
MNPEDLTNDEAPPLHIELHCNRCRKKARHEVPWVMWSPQADAEEWDGIVLGKVIECRGCGAVDDYTLATMSKAVVAMLALAEAETSPERSEVQRTGRVIMGLAALWDGTVFRRPSQGLAYLRELAARQPDNGEAWRRVGNLCERYGLPDEAEEAWRTAVCRDDREWEAVFSLAKHLRHDRPDEAFSFLCQAVERLPRATIDAESRVLFARALVALIGRVLDYTDEPLALMAMWTGERNGSNPIVHASSVDLRDVDGVSLAAFMARTDVVGMSLSPELPTDTPTQLGRLLDGWRLELPMSVPRLPYVSASMRAGRNDRCPCGSGKKFKKCCLGQASRAPSP